MLGCLFEIVETLVLTLIIFLVIQNFVALPYRVEQGSMVLSTDTAKVTRNGQSVVPQMVDEAIRKVCGGPKRRRNGDSRIAKEKEKD